MIINKFGILSATKDLLHYALTLLHVENILRCTHDGQILDKNNTSNC